MLGVLIVDDHPAVRAGVVALLRREPGIVPVAAAQGAQEAMMLLYSAFADDRLAVAARAAGADGVVSKGSPADELFAAIRAAASGRFTAPPRAVGLSASPARGWSPPICPSSAC